MYVIQEDPDHFKSVRVDDGVTCSFHQMNPGKEHPNICLRHGACGCRPPRYDQVRRTREEIAEIKAEKQRQHEDEVLAEAEVIKVARRLRQQRD